MVEILVAIFLCCEEVHRAKPVCACIAYYGTKRFLYIRFKYSTMYLPQLSIIHCLPTAIKKKGSYKAIY
jgi:hypothetical protein